MSEVESTSDILPASVKAAVDIAKQEQLTEIYNKYNFKLLRTEEMTIDSYRDNVSRLKFW